MNSPLQNPYNTYRPSSSGYASQEPLIYQLSPHMEALIIQSIRAGDLGNLQDLLSYIHYEKIQNNPSILYEAVTTGNPELVQLLLEKGFRPDLWNDYCPLIESIKRGFIDISILLINKHQDNLSFPQEFKIPLKSMHSFINGCYSNGHTPLHIATELNFVPLAKHLLQNEADIDLQDSKGNTPLHVALIQNTYPDFFPVFFAKEGINLTLENSESETPLHLAIRNKQYEAIDYFMRAQKNIIHHLDSKGANALSLAAYYQNTLSTNFFLIESGDVNQKNNAGVSPLELIFKQAHDKKQLEFLDGIIKINYFMLNICTFHNQLPSVKYFLDKYKFDLKELNEDDSTVFYRAKVFSRDIYNYFKEYDPQAYAFNQHFFERRLLAHISDTGGFTDIILKENHTNSAKVGLEGFNESCIYHLLNKRLEDFPDIPGLNRNLIDSLKDAAAFSAMSPSLSQLLERWQSGKPIYMNPGMRQHTIGLLIFDNEIVWCNLWQKESEDYGSYNAFCFEPHLLTEDVLREISFFEPTDEKLEFLQEKLPALLNGKKLPFHKLLEGHKAYAQKDTIGNCCWINTQGLQLPHAVLFEMKKLRSPPSQAEIEALIGKQSDLNDHLLSYYQYSISHKAIRRIDEGTSAYEPDCALVSRAFSFCYPYSNANLAPSLIKLWKDTEKLFYKCMPKQFTMAFKRQKHEYACLDYRQAQINELLTEVNQTPLLSQIEGGTRFYEDERPSKRRKTTHEQPANENTMTPQSREVISTELSPADALEREIANLRATFSIYQPPLPSNQ